MSESISYAVIWPVLLMVTLGIIQAGIWVHGHNVALRAAQAGAESARGSYGSTAEAHRIAGGIARSGGLSSVDVAVSTGGDTVEVRVSGRTPAILDLPLGRISESVTAPREQVSTP